MARQRIVLLEIDNEATMSNHDALLYDPVLLFREPRIRNKLWGTYLAFPKTSTMIKLATTRSLQDISDSLAEEFNVVSDRDMPEQMKYLVIPGNALKQVQLYVQRHYGLRLG